MSILFFDKKFGCGADPPPHFRTMSEISKFFLDGFPKAVIAEEVEVVELGIEKSMGVITGELNKTEEYLKELGDKVSRIVSRIDDIERYTQLHNFGYQSAQEAIEIHDHVLSKIQGESKYG